MRDAPPDSLRPPEPAAGPLYSVSQLTTPRNTFADDVEQLARTGAQGIGLWEAKLPPGDDAGTRARLARHGLAATLCVPALWTILPSRLAPEPADPARRLELICASLRRLAGFGPVAYLVTGGARGDRSPAAALDLVARNLAVIADAAAEVGGMVGLEPIRVGAGSVGPVVNTLAESVALLESVKRPNVGIIFDVWHLWDEPDRDRLIRAHADRIVGVQVNDWREPTRGWCDRALPGEGRADVAGIVAALLRSGYRGWYDLEIFSDDGRYGTAYPDSLWSLPHEELLARARGAFDRTWRQAHERLRAPGPAE
jgi:sugar phosphate isomerase/epimerase